MRDCWSEKLGDGWVRHHDYGLITYTRYGKEYVFCKKCENLFPESEADDTDGLCKSCFESEHTCSYCDELFLDQTLKSYDGDLYCENCMEEMVLHRRAFPKPLGRRMFLR